MASAARKPKGRLFVDWLTTTDHKKIGYLYLMTSFAYLIIGGIMALVIRAQLAAPGLEIVRPKSNTTSSSPCTAPSCF
jgi:cytochrome c oxidase subunit 1